MKTVFLTLYLQNLIGRQVLPGVARYAREQGGWNLLAFDRLPKKTEKPDGIIGIFGEGQRTEVEALQARGIPMVCLSGYDPIPEIPLVNHDDQAIGAMAADHLVAKGYRRFAYVHHPQAANAWRRLKGFQDRLAKLAMPEPSIWEGLADDLQAPLKLAEKPVGVFAFNDKRARSLEHACRKTGVSIPAQLGLLGVDNDDIECELCPVPLSSIVLSFSQTGWESARILDALMRGESAPEKILRLPPLRVEERLSTDPLQVEDAMIRRALARMKALMPNWPGVEALSVEVGMSKRTFELRFREATGETVHQRLQRMRVEEAVRLFQEERITVTEAGARVGVHDVNRLGQLIRKLTGKTPSFFRKREG